MSERQPLILPGAAKYPVTGWRLARVRIERTSTSARHRVRCQALTFVYDFGDGWEHTIKIENLVLPPKEGKRIRCLAGGAHAYFDFLVCHQGPDKRRT